MAKKNTVKSTSHIVVMGHPNVGKTTLFNALTGKQNKVVNYPGSTVDIAMGYLDTKKTVTILDLPGLSTLDPQSEDQKMALASLHQLNHWVTEANQSPDLIIYVMDNESPRKQLAQLKTLLDHKLPIQVLMNVRNTLCQDRKSALENQLQEQLACPVVAVNGPEDTALNRLKESCLSTIQNKPTQTQVLAKINKRNKSKIQADFEWAESVVQKIRPNLEVPKSNEIDWDRYVLHPVMGPIIFTSIMMIIFYSIFTLAAPLMDAVDYGIGGIMGLVKAIFPAHWVTDFIVDGAMTGLAAILVFAPQIAILFLGIGVLESTGYLARGTALVEKPLSKIGLNGRCFVPLLSGCACAIPAILATRTIQNPLRRKLCIFILPLMQCSARLPVYGLLLGALFGNHAIKSALGLTSIYIGSVVLSVIISAIGARIMGIQEDNSFHIQLPKWQRPNGAALLKNAWDQTKQFIVGAGPTIVAISLVLWGISTYPTEQNSIAMVIGRWIEPIFLPMGVDWRVGVAILLSFAAREVFVSALLVVLGTSSGSILTALPTITRYGTNTPMFTTPTIIGLILFFMIAMQCGTTLAVTKKETGSWKLPLLQLGTYILLAYIAAVAVVQVGALFT